MSNFIDKEEFCILRQSLVLPERILFLLDTYSEIHTNWDSQRSRFDIITEIQRKSHSTIQHQFAVATFDSNSVRIEQDFTSSTSEIEKSLTYINTRRETSCDEVVNLNTVFESVREWMESKERIPQSSRKFIDRCILIYSRSDQEPVISSTEIPLLQLPLYYLDVLYLHVKLTSDTASRCQAIYSVLSTLQIDSDPPKCSYLFECHPSTLRLLGFCAALTSHPAQRQDQTEFLEKLEVTDQSLSSIRGSLNNSESCLAQSELNGVDQSKTSSDANLSSTTSTTASTPNQSNAVDTSSRNGPEVNSKTDAPKSMTSKVRNFLKR